MVTERRAVHMATCPPTKSAVAFGGRPGATGKPIGLMHASLAGHRNGRPVTDWMWLWLSAVQFFDVGNWPLVQRTLSAPQTTTIKNVTCGSWERMPVAEV